MLAVAFHAAWLAQPLGWPLRIFHLAFIGISVMRPSDALLVLAGLAPLTTTLTVILQSPRAGWSLLEAMLWSLATGLLVRDPDPSAASRLKVPAFLLATVGLSSAIVSIAGDPCSSPGIRTSEGLPLSCGRDSCSSGQHPGFHCTWR